MNYTTGHHLMLVHNNVITQHMEDSIQELSYRRMHYFSLAAQ